VAKGEWTKEHLIGLKGLSASEITVILDLAEQYKPVAERKKP